MVKKNTLILVIVAVLLVGAYILLQNQGKLDFSAKPEEPTVTPLPAFLQLEGANLVSLQLSRPEKEDLVVSKASDGTWQINTPGGNITTGNMEQIVAEFNAIQTEQLLSLDLDLTSLGLDKPQYTFTLTFSDNTQKVVKIGSANPLNTGYYAQLDAGAPVLISQGSIDSIVSILVEAATPPTPTPAPTSNNG